MITHVNGCIQPKTRGTLFISRPEVLEIQSSANGIQVLLGGIVAVFLGTTLDDTNLLKVPYVLMMREEAGTNEVIFA